MPASCVLIWRGDGYQLYVIALVGLTAIVGIGLNVLLGLSGQISLGHVAFYAIGAYAVGILTTRLGCRFWLALPAAGALAALAGALLAIPALRVRGPYLAMVTIAFGFVVEQGAAEWSGLTGGWNGLIGIPPPRLFGVDFTDRDTAFLVLALTIVALVLYAPAERQPLGQGDARGARFGDREPVDRARSDAHPHRRVRGVGGRRRHRGRRVRVAEQLHQSGILPILPVDPVPAGGDAGRRRPRVRAAGRRRRSWCCCRKCCRSWPDTGCCSSAR